MNLPHDAYRWNKAILGSFKKGILAHQAGQSIESCPYGDKRNMTWLDEMSGAWRKEKNFFETRVTEYQTASSLVWDDDDQAS